MEILEMSKKERERLDVVKRLVAGKLSQQMAAKELHLTTRQVRRLQCSYAEVGAKGLLSKRRGCPSNHQLAFKLKRLVVEIIRSRYADFGPTLAHEKLTEEHGLNVGLETVRQLMITHGLWHPRKQRRGGPVHQLRERRPRFGELIQIDGSPHDWFEGRSPRCTLIVFIDDATGRLQQLRFVPAETTFAYFTVLHQYVVTFGKPVALYSDKFGVFRVNKPYLANKADSTGLTQFGRAMHELNIELICANSPQAKGRVERANQTLQDRLVKELRLRGIADVDAANAFLPSFAASYNRKFAVAAQSPADAHRPLLAQEQLDDILTLQATRTLSKNLTLQYERALYQITAAIASYRLRHQRVLVRENAAAEVTITLNGKPLAYRIYHRAPKQGTVLSVKEVQALQWGDGQPRDLPAQEDIAQVESLAAQPPPAHSTGKPKSAQRSGAPPGSAWRKMITASAQNGLQEKLQRQQSARSTAK